MKTFYNLIQKVHKHRLCCKCGACAAFCSALNYGALTIDQHGKPVYGNAEKCIECGLCYSICPETDELDQQIKQLASWSEPLGKIIETTVIRSSDPMLRDLAMDENAVLAILLHLFDNKMIDGVFFSKPVGKLLHQPFLATSRQEMLDLTGHIGSAPHVLEKSCDFYAVFSMVNMFKSIVRKGLSRIALVVTPCQIKAIRKMQALNLIPSNSIKICIGIFCSGNVNLRDKEKQKLANIAAVSWDEVNGLSLMDDDIIVTLKSGDTRKVDSKVMESIKSAGCHYCADYSAQFSDISCGAFGKEKGWTTIITRTLLGKSVLTDILRSKNIEQFSVEKNSEFAAAAHKRVRTSGAAKRKKARYKRHELKKKSIQVKI